MDIKIYSFTNPTSHKKTSNTTSFCLCSLTFTTLSQQWQFRWECGKMWLEGGTTPLPWISWTATWKLVSRLTKGFPRLTKTHTDVSKNYPRWLNTSSLTDKARVSCTYKVTQDQPQLNEKTSVSNLCQTSVLSVRKVVVAVSLCEAWVWSVTNPYIKRRAFLYPPSLLPFL